MTARSFTEAFAKARTDDDILADIDTWHRWNAGSPLSESYPTTSDAQNALARVLDAVPSLLGRVRWAVTLEGQNAVLLRLARRYYEHVWEFCCASRDELTTDGLTVLCSLDADHDGDHLFIEGDVLGLAALTGSTE